MSKQSYVDDIRKLEREAKIEAIVGTLLMFAMVIGISFMCASGV